MTMPSKPPVRKVFTKTPTTVPKFAKDWRGKRWWCGRPECCFSTTQKCDLPRHYKEHHRKFVDEEEMVVEAESAAWQNCSYLDSRHATDEEKQVRIKREGNGCVALKKRQCKVSAILLSPSFFEYFLGL